MSDSNQDGEEGISESQKQAIKAEVERLTGLLQKCKAQLGEHFDSVQIICTTYEGEGGTIPGTMLYHAGTGNTFTRIAATEQWLENRRNDFIDE